MNNNKRYLITGASSDIGVTVLKKLQQQAKVQSEQITVFAHTRGNENRLLELAKELPDLHMICHVADLSVSREVEAMLEKIHNTIEVPTHFLHLPASPLHYQKLKDTSWEQLLLDMEIQVHSFHTIAKALFPKMGKLKTGKIVVMLSECTLGVPPKFMSSYVTVKYALLGLTKALAAEYAEKGLNINAISPAMMETKFLSEIDERLIEMNAAASVMKRNVAPEEVAEAICYLLSDGSNYMSGVNLNITGGNK